MPGKKRTRNILLIGLGGIVIGFILFIFFHSVMVKTSTSEYCMSCHIHEEADAAWKKSVHYNSKSGTVTDCAACHLPPEEEGVLKYMMAKAKMGAKDFWAYWTKDKEELDFAKMGELEHAVKTVYNSSCEKCHVNLFPEGMSDDGVTAHLYYEENAKKLNLQCISCHLDAGHYNPNYKHTKMTEAVEVNSGVVYDSAATVTRFENFTETVPGTGVSINMVAVPGGEFTIGSSEKEPFHKKDEGPQKNVKISRFFMSEVEVTWNQYWAFYNETMSEGRTPPEKVYANNSRPDVDAVSGPTPPFGFPDQGWGMGSRPAITMTHYAAETFCQWLSLKTGKKYRLPTEAEWEYAARGGTSTPYFFEGNPKKFSNEGLWNRIFGSDTAMIARYVVYSEDSDGKTAEPEKIGANPFGLKNMLGNVLEYCSDWYQEDAYSKLKDGELDPKGPSEGSEYVVRGGSYASDAADVRCSSRGHTENEAWLRTDPQNPKSIWWYSDIKGIGFRIVCEVPEGID